MIVFSKVTQKWIPGLHTKGIVHEYSNSEASFLNHLGVKEVTNAWFFDTDLAVNAFKRLDTDNVLDEKVSKSVFDKVYLDMGIAIHALREAYAKRSLNDQDIASLPDLVKAQFIKEKSDDTHRDRTAALGRILHELEEIFEQYTAKDKRLTPALPTPAPRPPSLTFKALPVGEELPEDDDPDTGSLPPQRTKKVSQPTLAQQFEELVPEFASAAEPAAKKETPAERRKRRLAIQQATAAALKPLSATDRASKGASELRDEDGDTRSRGEKKQLDAETIERWVYVKKITNNLPDSDLADKLIPLMGSIDDALIDIKQPVARNAAVIALIEQAEQALDDVEKEGGVIDTLISQTQLLDNPERETMMRYNTKLEEIEEIEELPDHEKYKEMQKIIMEWKGNVTVSLRYQKMKLILSEATVSRLYDLKGKMNKYTFGTKEYKVVHLCNQKINELIDAGPGDPKFEKTLDMYIAKWETVP